MYGSVCLYVDDGFWLLSSASSIFPYDHVPMETYENFSPRSDDDPRDRDEKERRKKNGRGGRIP